MAALDNAYAHDASHDDILQDRIELAKEMSVVYEAQGKELAKKKYILQRWEDLNLYLLLLLISKKKKKQK